MMVLERIEYDGAPVETSVAGTIPDDFELLDSYSKAVTKVVADVGPTVVHLARWARMRNSDHDRQRWLPSGSGSGVVLAPDGYILTNAHVGQGARRLEVKLPQGD